MSTVRIKGDTSGYYDLTVPNVAGAGTVHLDKIPQTDSNTTFDAGGTFTVVKVASTQYTDLELHDTTNDYAWILSNRGTSPGLFEVLTRDTNGTYTQPLKINAGGAIQKPYQPSFKVYDNSGTEYTNATLLPNVVVHDTGSNFNTANGRFTCPVDGVYLFRCDWRQTNSGAGYLDIRSSDGQLVRHEEANATIGNWFHQSITAIFKLSANDYVWLQSGGTKGIRWDTNPVNHFAGVLIG